MPRPPAEPAPVDQPPAFRNSRYYVPLNVAQAPPQTAQPMRRPMPRSKSRQRQADAMFAQPQRPVTQGAPASAHIPLTKLQPVKIGAHGMKEQRAMQQGASQPCSPMKLDPATSDAADSARIGTLPVSDVSPPRAHATYPARPHSNSAAFSQRLAQRSSQHNSGAITTTAAMVEPPPAARVAAPATNAASPACELDPLAGYTLGKVIGEGGFCQVRAGVHQLSGRQVAVKVIRKVRSRQIASFFAMFSSRQQSWVMFAVLQSLNRNEEVSNCLHCLGSCNVTVRSVAVSH